MSTTKSTHFVVNKDGWYTKEGHEKSMKNALYVQYSGMAKGTSRRPTAKKIRLIALAIVELRESEGIRQAGRKLAT